MKFNKVWAFCFLPLFLGSVIACSAFAQKKKCLTYEPDAAEISGTLEEKKFPGAPNFESTSEGDSVEVVYVLHLLSPACVFNPNKSDDLNINEKNIESIQVAPHANLDLGLKKNIGRKVIVKGKLFHAITAHHHTDVLIFADSIRAIGK